MVVARRPAVHTRSQSAAYRGSVCPVCKRSDRAEKASSVVAQNSGTVWGDNGTSFHFRNELAMTLAIPPRPDAPGWSKAAKALGASFAVAGILLAVSQIINSMTSVPYAVELTFLVALGFFAVLMPLRILAVTYVQRRLMAQRLPGWTDASARWHRVYYCFRDDVVFVEGQLVYFASRDIEKLLMLDRSPAAQKLVLRQAPLES